MAHGYCKANEDKFSEQSISTGTFRTYKALNNSGHEKLLLRNIIIILINSGQEKLLLQNINQQYGISCHSKLESNAMQPVVS